LYQQGGLSVLSSIGETEKSIVGEGDSHVIFGKKITSEKESETVRCCDATASSSVPKVQGEVFAHFHAVP
jgi:hypothetical protein